MSLAGRDLCGIAQTGTGKTAAFALPILHRLASSARRAAPRRLPRAGAEPDPGTGQPDRRQLQHLWPPACRSPPRLCSAACRSARSNADLRRGVDILVATPGRLLDLIDRRAALLSRVEILVLDEADRMLDLGFIHALKKIVKLLPQHRQTLLFSATMPRAIADLGRGLSRPIRSR